MITSFLQLDGQLFTAINHLPHNFILNSFFAFLSGVGRWGIIWIVIALALFIWEEKKNHQKLIALFLGLVSSGVLVELLKNLIKRVRPEIAIPTVITFGAKSFDYSFPSGHATIAFAAAFILGWHHQRLKWAYYLLAILIAFSRIYLGKHYPGDVIAGAAVGLLIGYVSVIFTQKYLSKIKNFSR